MSNETTLGDPASLKFHGRTILVVEDEALVSLLVEDTLRQEGALVWLASRIDDAIKLLRERLPDAAVLDVNLAGELVYPVAEQLDAAGVPFIFATGYGQIGIPRRWASRPVVPKPFSPLVLVRALAGALAR